MTNVSPSPDNAKKDGLRVHRLEYPEGLAGVHLSLERIALMIREGRADPLVRGWAGDALIAAGRPQGNFRQACALLDALRKHTMYVSDPVQTEMNVAAAGTLCLRPGFCVKAADCFPADTLLLRDDGELVQIQNIKNGDRIWGLDAWCEVRGHTAKGDLWQDALVLNNGAVVYLTPDHHVYVPTCFGNSRIRVSEVVAGTPLLQPAREFVRKFVRPVDGRGLVVNSILRSKVHGPCYDITTSDGYVYLPEHDVTVSNCDDLVIALGSILMSVGIPARVLKQSYGDSDQEHVLIEAAREDGTWFPLDPSTNLPCGSKAAASKEYRMDPMAPNMAGLSGTPDAQYVGIGSILRRTLGAFPALPSVVVSGPYAQASTDLENQVVLGITAGDTYYSASEYGSAIQAYQAAGHAGAVGVGPEIDLAGAASVTQAYTQVAWQLNGQLAQFSPTSTAQADADAARQTVMAMLSAYQLAMKAGAIALSNGGVPSAGPSLNVPQAFGITLMTGLVAGLAYEAWRTRNYYPKARRRARR
jgi:hypothetical protein